MYKLQYSDFQTTNPDPVYIYVERPLYCWGLGNFVGSLLDITLTILLIVTIPITLPIVMCCEKIHNWKKGRGNR